MARDSSEAYLATIDRIEPEVAPIDAAAFYASAAISLRRIADAAEAIAGAIVVIVARMQDDADDEADKAPPA
jgi:hypothetical protein